MTNWVSVHNAEKQIFLNLKCANFFKPGLIWIWKSNKSVYIFFYYKYYVFIEKYLQM